jgi:hypothetical protein
MGHSTGFMQCLVSQYTAKALACSSAAAVHVNIKAMKLGATCRNSFKNTPEKTFSIVYQRTSAYFLESTSSKSPPT